MNVFLLQNIVFDIFHNFFKNFVYYDGTVILQEWYLIKALFMNLSSETYSRVLKLSYLHYFVYVFFPNQILSVQRLIFLKAILLFLHFQGVILAMIVED